MHFSRLAPILALVCALEAAKSPFVTPPTDLISKTGYAGVKVRYKQVPAGICEQDPDVKSYSGYADVAENQHIFWWFFEARNQDPTTAPLTVWINGGPGSSSMIGLWQENGPCFVNASGDVYNNPYSWSNVSNMIYIDQPTQTGFSYSIPVPGYTDPNSGLFVQLPSNKCPDYAADWDCMTYSYPNETLTANTTAAAAPNFWLTLQGFMGAFPQYSRDGFIFTTESYGGHYGPVFNEYILQQNAKNITGAHKINLEAVLIGNGWYDPLIQYQAYYNFTQQNTYNYFPLNKSISAIMYNNLYGPGNCVDQIKDCAAHGSDETCLSADNFCANQVENIFDIYAGRDEYDFRELSPDPFPPEFYVDYLNTPKVQAAIGAYVNYTESSNGVYYAFTATGDDNREAGTVQDMLKLIEANVTVIMYTGDADYNCNWIGGEVVSKEIGAPGFSDAGYVNITTVDKIVHGQVKQAAKFAFARIYESGHEVPFYQPVVALALLERAIAGKDIATGTQVVGKGYVTKGTARSTYMEGNSTVQFQVVPVDDIYNTTTGQPMNTTKIPGARIKRGLPYLFGQRLREEGE